MEAKELRIGNYVMLNNPTYHQDIKGKTCVVKGILLKTYESFPKSTGVITIENKGHRRDQLDEFIEPIPLTEEWLLKFGFEVSGHLIFISIGNGYSLCYNTHSGICFISAPTSLNYLPPLKDIHQLQNIYHALTGEELTAKV